MEAEADCFLVRTKPLHVAVGSNNKLLLFSPHHLGKQAMTEIKLPDIHKLGCMTYDSLSGSIIMSDIKQRKIYRFNLKTEEIVSTVNVIVVSMTILCLFS